MADSLAKALIAIQADAPPILLDSTNPHFRSRYPSLAGVMEKVRPVTSKHGVAIVQLPTILDGAPALTTRLIHAQTGEVMESTMLLLPVKPDPQGQGSALTYARRYMVLSMLGLVGDEDDDANAASTQSDADGGGGDESPSGSVVNSTAVVSTGFASDKQASFFERLLKKRGVSSNQVEAIKRYAETIPTDRVSKAMDGLNSKDSEEADKAVAALLRLSDEYALTQSDLPWDENA